MKITWKKLAGAVTALGACVATYSFYPETVRFYASSTASCSSNTDCVFASSKCPFGCYLAVRRSNQAFINRLIQLYPSTCLYKCGLPPELRCMNQICTLVRQ